MVEGATVGLKKGESLGWMLGAEVTTTGSGMDATENKMEFVMLRFYAEYTMNHLMELLCSR